MPPLGLGYLTSNSHTAFPFKEDALGLARENTAAVHGVNAKLPLDFLIDAVIYMPPDLQAEYPAAYLRKITKLLPTSWLINITDRSGATTLCDVICTTGGNTVIGVQDTEATRITARFLKGPGFDAYLADTVEDSFENTLPLEDCVVEPRPYKLDSIIVCDSAGVPKSGQLTGDIVLRCGYNVNIVTAEAAEYDGTDVTLEVIPAVGEGIAPASEAPTPPALNAAPMGLIPDQMGGVRIVTDDCYEVVTLPPSYDNKLHLQIQGNCYACCTCEQYVAVAKALKRLIARSSSLENYIIKASNSLANRYLQLVSDYNTTYYPQRRKIYVTAKAIVGVKSQENRAFAGRQLLGVAVRIVNRSDAVAKSVSAKVTPQGGGTAFKLAASFTKGKYNNVFQGEAETLDIGELQTDEGVSSSWYFTTRDPTTPVTRVTVLVTYTLHSIPHVESFVVVPEGIES